MKIYRGKNDGDRRVVTVDGRPLIGLYPSNARRNKQFDWGIRPPSRGAIHLAEAILADYTGRNVANPFAHQFAADRLAKESPESFECSSEDIEKWLRIQCNFLHPARPDSYVPGGVLRVPTDLPKFLDRLENLRERIKPDELARHGFPRPKDVQLSRNTDSTGEDAYYVYLIFSDKTPEEALAWEKIEPMVSWVRNLIWTETGARLWPYVKVKLQKQMAGALA